jgi:type VI protein secretion system component Hcp
MVATLFVKMTDSSGKELKGDATEDSAKDKKLSHNEWIVVNSVSFKLSRTSEQEGGAVTRGFGKAKLEGMEFDSEVGSHSMPLILASASGLRFKEVLIHQCKSDENSNSALKPYIMWILHDAMIQSYGISGDSEDIPKEQWVLTYAKIECEYHKTDLKTGALSKANDFKWDLAKGDMS